LRDPAAAQRTLSLTDAARWADQLGARTLNA
jgi:hypothetical protein